MKQKLELELKLKWELSVANTILNTHCSLLLLLMRSALMCVCEYMYLSVCGRQRHWLKSFICIECFAAATAAAQLQQPAAQRGQREQQKERKDTERVCVCVCGERERGWQADCANAHGCFCSLPLLLLCCCCCWFVLMLIYLAGPIASLAAFKMSEVFACKK